MSQGCEIKVDVDRREEYCVAHQSLTALCPELLAEVRAALEKIRDFDHDPQCKSRVVPVFECCCYSEAPWDIAKNALTRLGR